ncbi:ScyD/ScyE family protein [Kineococcus sp. T13]|uniref:ScyD/ScyE family protein n=1 Tax=Kineococcus vitellinus TaxID=2696565 RepID=UPI001412600F|nr:ScyD/ScyE family protein [Kineococcus vitellinus]NAZ75055.1 ScyD/ScyE family protein [Kineococcus vitellinus]
MAHRLQSAALVLVAAAATAVTTAAPAHAAGAHHDHDPITVVADGLDDPFGLSAENGRFYVAESGSGEISGIIPGGDGPSVRVGGITGITGVDRRDGTLFHLTGEAEPGTGGGSTLWTSRRGEPRKALADLLAYELANNPDGQRQFGDDGAPLDALSNPFSVLADRGQGADVYVADAGANAVLAVDAKGTVSTFFVPPLVTTGACEGAENNDPEHVGCDSVPTGLAWGPDGNLYVSTLGAEAPGAARVYVLDPHDGSVVERIDGFTGAVGVAVGDDGSVYVSELFEGAPQTPELPPDFDISTLGQVVRVAPDGTRSAAQVTLPLGLRFADGALHSTAWSVVGSALGQTGAGQVVRVDDSAFSPLD